MGLSITGQQQDTLRDALVREMKNKEVTATMIASAKDISLVNLSRMLGGSRTFSLEILDAVTEVLELPAGHFYPYYIKECWAKEGNRLRKKTEEYVIRCLELGLMNLVQNMMNELTAIPGNLQTVFSIGETLFGMGRQDESLPFYEKVIEKETNRLSTDLAVSYYRRFLIVRDRDMVTAFEAAVKLTDYIQNIKGLLRTEAYHKILAVFYTTEHWSAVEKYSKDLEDYVTGTDLIAYGGALYYQAVAARAKQEYQKALSLIEKYGTGISDMYTLWAEGNRMVVQILSGETQMVYKLMDFIKRNTDRYRYLDTVLQALVRENRFEEVDKFMFDFEEQINKLFLITDPVTVKHAINFTYHKALYLLKRGQELEGVAVAIDALQLATQYKISVDIIRCFKLILRSSRTLSDDQVSECIKALEEYETTSASDTICII